MKVFYGLFVVFALSLCSYAQEKRVINWAPGASEQGYVNDEARNSIASSVRALEIVAITAEGNPIVPGSEFSAGEDWLRTFAIKVRNVSERKISSIRLSFALRMVKDGDVLAGFSLEYGKELSTQFDRVVQPPIEPGQEIVLVRSDSHFDRDRNWIAKKTGRTDFNCILIGLSVVKFDDGTVWYVHKLPIASARTARN